MAKLSSTHIFGNLVVDGNIISDGNIDGNTDTASKVNNSIKIRLNGGTTENTNQFTFDGSEAKNVNITPSSIGAATTNTATTSTNGLMSSADKSKLDGITAGANKITVDSSMSTTSVNPVQNNTIKLYVDTETNRAKAAEEALQTAINSKSDFDGDYNSLTNKPIIPTKLSQLTNYAMVTLCENLVITNPQTDLDLYFDQLDKPMMPIGDIEIEMNATSTNNVTSDFIFRAEDFTDVSENIWEMKTDQYTLYVQRHGDEGYIWVFFFPGSDYVRPFTINKITLRQMQKEVKITPEDVDYILYESIRNVPQPLVNIANKQDKALTPVESNELLYGMRNLLKFSELTLSDMQQSPFNEGYITAVETYRTGFFIRHNYVEGSKQSKGVKLTLEKNTNYTLAWSYRNHDLDGLVVSVVYPNGNIVFEVDILDEISQNISGYNFNTGNNSYIYILFSVKKDITYGMGLEDWTVFLFKKDSGKNNLSNIMYTDNTCEYIPTSDYNPATKKYVDEHVQAASKVAFSDNQTLQQKLDSGVLNGKSVSFLVVTEAEYNAIANKDPNVIYLIKEEY